MISEIHDAAEMEPEHTVHAHRHRHSNDHRSRGHRPLRPAKTITATRCIIRAKKEGRQAVSGSRYQLRFSARLVRFGIDTNARRENLEHDVQSIDLCQMDPRLALAVFLLLRGVEMVMGYSARSRGRGCRLDQGAEEYAARDHRDRFVMKCGSCGEELTKLGRTTPLL